jgi:5-methyltetrahydrofolate--homocysteine methyltransferase
MIAAIIHVSKIEPLHRIDALHREAAEDLIFDHHRDGQDPLLRFITLFKDHAVKETRKAHPATIEEALKQRIVDGDRQGLEQDLGRALKKYSALEIINTLLLDGMRVVGELFGAGQMQLPFVLQSAETMKAAVAYLQPFMERVTGLEKGTLVLATVKGDVHDIGKNLVDIILTNNGYRVVNLGIKQPLHTILEAYTAQRADAIGMSGLLVKSTVIMKENLEEMARLGIDVPVLLGGAALTRRYVEQDCRAAYTRPEAVHYAKDAFAGLHLMAAIMAAKSAAGRN